MKMISFCIDLIEDTNKKITSLTNQLLDLIMVNIFPKAKNFIVTYLLKQYDEDIGE